MGKIQRDNKTGKYKLLDIDETLLTSLYETGISESEIARQLGLKQQTVSNRLRALGFPSLRAKLQPMVELNSLWLCERCSQYKEKKEFIYSKDGKLRFRFCKSCKHRASTESVHKTTVSYVRNSIRHKKHQCKKLNLAFDLDVDYCLVLWDLQKGKCFYTDIDLTIDNTNETRHNHYSASLDKIIPEKSYTKGNVVWCQQRINVMKNDATLEEMREWMPNWYSRIKSFLEKDNF